MKKRAETLKAKLLTLFKNLSLRWKIFFIVLLNVVSLLLFSLIGFTILSRPIMNCSTDPLREI